MPKISKDDFDDFGNDHIEYLRYKKTTYDADKSNLLYRLKNYGNNPKTKKAYDDHIASWRAKPEICFKIDVNKFCHVTAYYQADCIETTIMYKPKSNTWYNFDMQKEFVSLDDAKANAEKMIKNKWGICNKKPMLLTM